MLEAHIIKIVVRAKAANQVTDASVISSGDGCIRHLVIPAKAGIQWRSSKRRWVSAFAGTTNIWQNAVPF
jgi:hypothetical protein